jgi:hypothetical protein
MGVDDSVVCETKVPIRSLLFFARDVAKSGFAFHFE